MYNIVFCTVDIRVVMRTEKANSLENLAVYCRMKTKLYSEVYTNMYNTDTSVVLGSVLNIVGGKHSLKMSAS